MFFFESLSKHTNLLIRLLQRIAGVRVIVTGEFVNLLAAVRCSHHLQFPYTALYIDDDHRLDPVFIVSVPHFHVCSIFMF